jgi:predicted PurR-regulated permease PerM
LQTFGLLGIFIGPMIVAVGKAMLVEWLTYLRPDPPVSGVSQPRVSPR